MNHTLSITYIQSRGYFEQSVPFPGEPIAVHVITVTFQKQLGVLPVTVPTHPGAVWLFTTQVQT